MPPGMVNYSYKRVLKFDIFNKKAYISHINSPL